MNLKKFDNNMTRNPLFINIIDNQRKCVKSTMGHPKIKHGNNCGGFNKGTKNMGFHGFVDHFKYYFIT
jgi:hypothetical protein